MNTDKLMELEQMAAWCVKIGADHGPATKRDLNTISATLRGIAAALRAEQAVGEEQIARELLPSDDFAHGIAFIKKHRNVLLRLAGSISEGFVVERTIEALGTARQSEGVVPNGLRVIGELLRTQDNRITDSPIFIVQQKRTIAGVDTDYGGVLVWVDNDSNEVTDPTEAAKLEAYWAEHCVEPDGYTRTGKAEIWEFVTACFTEQGCKDYLARDGHNLKEPRIYAAGSYRNEEFRAVRKFLMSLAAAPGGEGEG